MEINEYYETSKDYQFLWELIKEKKIICFLKTDKNSIFNYDIARNSISINEYKKLFKTKAEKVIIGTIGISYIEIYNENGFTLEDYWKFEKRCKFYDLSFIEPKEI